MHRRLKGLSGLWGFGDMNRGSTIGSLSQFSLCDILGPFPKGSEGNVVKFAVLLASKTAGSPTGNMLFFSVQ